MDFNELKNSRGGKSLESLAKELEKLNSSSDNTKDDRLWYPVTDKAGNGYAVIRFLPAPGNEPTPFVRIFRHSFKGPTGKWYIENSLTSIGQQDIMSEVNSKLWNSTTDDNSPARKQARNQKRNLTYISNVYIVSDPANPENNGKVKLYQYGKKIFDKIQEAMTPKFADEAPMDPFNFWDGANFKIKIWTETVGNSKFKNYDKSSFDTPGPLFADDDDIQTVWKQEHSLQYFLSPANYKTPEQLKKQYEYVMGDNVTAKTSEARHKASEAASDPFGDDDIPLFDEPVEVVHKPSKPAPKPSKPVAVVEDEEDFDVELAMFEKMARS